MKIQVPRFIEWIIDRRVLCESSVRSVALW